MTRKVQMNNMHLQFLEIVTDDDNNVICFRCEICNKFIKRAWSSFFCPHCDVSFMEDVSSDDQRSIENLINYIEDIGKLLE